MNLGFSLPAFLPRRYYDMTCPVSEKLKLSGTRLQRLVVAPVLAWLCSLGFGELVVAWESLFERPSMHKAMTGLDDLCSLLLTFGGPEYWASQKTLHTRRP